MYLLIRKRSEEKHLGNPNEHKVVLALPTSSLLFSTLSRLETQTPQRNNKNAVSSALTKFSFIIET
jgi:hypothetical protein